MFGVRRWADVTAINRGFCSDKRGSVGVLFALMLLSLLMLIGGAVDLGRWMNAREKTINAIDAAILAAGRSLQTGATNEAAIAVAVKMYKKNAENRIKVVDDTVHFEIVDDGMRIKTLGTVDIETPFLSFARVEKLRLFDSKEAPEATRAQEVNHRFHREFALMLDVSGSMCPSGDCTKLNAMKAAATDLVNIVMRNNATSDYKARVSLIPFSGEVKPPAALFAAVTDPALTSSINDTSKGSLSKSACVAERGGAKKYSDDVPGPGSYIPVVYGSCGISTQMVVPLTTDSEIIKSNIAALKTASGTAGEIGTAWARYMISPNWASVLGASAPVPFGTPETKKIAILMTDGEYNEVNRYLTTQTWVGSHTETYACRVRGRWTTCTRTVDDYETTVHQNAAYPTSSDSASINGVSPSAQAIEHCQAMKDDGIEVFTVGFDLGNNQTAIDTLATCATDASHAYVATNAEALRVAFRDIAIKASELFVSQ